MVYEKVKIKDILYLYNKKHKNIREIAEFFNVNTTSVTEIYI